MHRKNNEREKSENKNSAARLLFTRDEMGDERVLPRVPKQPTGLYHRGLIREGFTVYYRYETGEEKRNCRLGGA